MRTNKLKFLSLTCCFIVVMAGSFFVSPKTVSATITYSASNNRISLVGDASCGNSEANSCGFQDIYDADKAGTLTLIDRSGITGADSSPVNNSHNLRPADEKLLGGAKQDLHITIKNWNGTSATVRIIGTDENDAALTEDIIVNANGTYYASNLFKTLMQTQVVAFTGTSFGYELTQEQWGAIFKEGYQYFVDCDLEIGNGATETYLKVVYPDMIQVGTSSDRRTIYPRNNCHFQFGEKDSEGFGVNGASLVYYCLFHSPYNYWRGEINFYGSYFYRDIQGAGYGDCAFGGVVDFVDSIFSSDDRWYFPNGGSGNLTRTTFDTPTWLYVYTTGLAIDAIKLPQNADGILSGGNSTITGVDYGTTKRQNCYYNSTNNLVDCNILDSNISFWNGSSNGNVYKKYHFNLKAIDKNNSPIDGASVKIWDSQDSLVVDTTTNGDGEIAEQLLTVYLAHYNSGDSPPQTNTNYNPFRIYVAHQNYPSREFEFVVDRETDWTVAMKDRPQDVGLLKVWGTEYADDEDGTIYAQILYGDGTPCNTISSSDIIATVYASDATVIINAVQMSYVSGSNGIYKYDFSGGTFSEEGVYIIDVEVDSASPEIVAYNSNEIHISQTANKIKSMVSDVWENSSRTLTDYDAAAIATEVWGYSGRSLDVFDNIISGVWGEPQLGYNTAGTFGYNLDSRISDVAFGVWSYSTRTLTSFESLVSDIWSNSDRTLTSGASIAQDIWNAGDRKLSSRQVGDSSDYIARQYDLDLVRQSTFDFAGFADSGSTTTLTDTELTQSDDYWNNYRLRMMSGANLGEEQTVSDFDAASDTITVSAAFSNAIVDGDKYALLREERLIDNIWNYSSRTLTSAAGVAGDIWGYTGGRTLTSFGNLAADIWSDVFAPTRRLTDETLTGGGGLATESYVDTTTSTIIAEVDANESKIDSVYTDTQYIRGEVDNILAKWGIYSAADIMTDLDTVKLRIGTSADSSAEETLFGRTKFLQEKWDTQTAQIIYDRADDAYDKIVEVQTELGYNGASTVAYSDLQDVLAYVDEIEGYIGMPSDNSSDSTLFGRIRDVREKLDQLDVLETKIDAIDVLIGDVRTSQQLNYTVELSDLGEIKTEKIYRAKLTILDFESNPVNALSAPTITIYDALRVMADSGNMTLLSTGVYEYTYTVPTDATAGLWESIANVDLGGATPLTLNDYWEVGGSPAQVIINNISDLIVPSISANVTISNEGNSGYEYQYEWCVVAAQNNQCGGGDDIDYASAAKYLNVGEDWTTDLSLTVPDIGSYWFKVVVYYGSEASGASRTFTAVEESGGGGSTSSTSESGTAPDYNSDFYQYSDIHSKLLEIQNELGYHDTQRTVFQDLSNTRYNLGALPGQLEDPLYVILNNISSEIENIGGTKEYSLNKIYEVSQANSSDLKYIVNKLSGLRAMIDINKTLISKVNDEPIIQTWFTEGSIILNILVINPSEKNKIITVKEYLPEEIRGENIIDIEEGLRLEYDFGLDVYFVTGEVELSPKQEKVLKVEVEDVFKISENELNAFKKQAEALAKPLDNTRYFAQASILKAEINANADRILRRQTIQPINIEKRISLFRDSQKDLQQVYENMDSLKQIAVEAKNRGVFGNLFDVSANAIWIIIATIIAVIVIAAGVFYVVSIRCRNKNSN